MYQGKHLHQWLGIVISLSTCFWLIQPTAYGRLTDKPAINDADMQEVLSLLFEKELHPLAEGKEVTVLLAPSFQANWIPKITGVLFKQLSYEETKQVSEYYELEYSRARHNDIQIELTRGNAWKQAGRRYHFRKKQGEWQIEDSKAVESFTDVGSCAGCGAGSGAVSTSLKRADAILAQPRPLVLKGQVLAIRCSRDDKHRYECQADLNLNFFNAGSTPLIILQPHGEYTFWHGGTSLALTKADAEANRNVYDLSAWPSVYTFPEYDRLAQRLDQPAPPAGVTRIITPGEGWSWKTIVQFRLAEENTYNGLRGLEIGWQEVQKLTSPLWLQVSYEMWPFNVENFKKNLGGTLRKRWRQYGTLYLDEKSNGYWFARITSEPFELDLR